MTFKVGDVVSLKSGNAGMTVEIVADDAIHCVWSDGKKTLRDQFHPQTLIMGIFSPDDFFRQELDKQSN